MFKSCFSTSSDVAAESGRPPGLPRESVTLSTAVRGDAARRAPRKPANKSSRPSTHSYQRNGRRHTFAGNSQQAGHQKPVGQRRSSAVLIGHAKDDKLMPRRVKSTGNSVYRKSAGRSQSSVVYKLPKRDYNIPSRTFPKYKPTIPKPSRLIKDLKQEKPTTIQTLHMPIVVHSQTSWKPQHGLPGARQSRSLHSKKSLTSLVSHGDGISRRNSHSGTTRATINSSNLRVVSRQSSRPRTRQAADPKTPVEVICEPIFSRVNRKEESHSANHVYLPYNPSFGLSATQHKDIQKVIKRSQQRQTTRRQENTPRPVHRNRSCQQVSRKDRENTPAAKTVPPSAPANLRSLRATASRNNVRASDSANVLGLSSKRFAKLERAVQNKLIERLSQKQGGSRRQQSTGSIDRTTTEASAASPISGLLAQPQQGDYLDVVLKCVAEKQFSASHGQSVDSYSKAKHKAKWLGRSKTSGKLVKQNSMSSVHPSRNGSATTRSNMLFVNDIYNDAAGKRKEEPSQPFTRKPNPHFSAYTQKLMQLTPRDSSEHSTPRVLPSKVANRNSRVAYENPDTSDFNLDPGGHTNHKIGEATFLEDTDDSELKPKTAFNRSAARARRDATNSKAHSQEEKGVPVEKEKQTNKNLSKYVKQLKRRLSNAAAKGSVMAMSRNNEAKDTTSRGETASGDAIPAQKPAMSLATANAPVNVPIHRSSTVVRPPSGRPKINRAYSTHIASTSRPVKIPQSSAVPHQNAIIRRHQLNLHDEIDKIAPKPPSQDPSYASNSQSSSSESQSGSADNVDDDVSTASEDEGVDVTATAVEKPQDCHGQATTNPTPQAPANPTLNHDRFTPNPKSSFRSTLTNKIKPRPTSNTGKRNAIIQKSQTFVVDGSKYRARYASTNHDESNRVKDATKIRRERTSVNRQSSFNQFNYRHSSTNKKLGGSTATLHNKFSVSNNELSPAVQRGRSPAVGYGNKMVGGSNGALARRFQKNSPKPALTAAQISEKIKKEIDVNSRSTAQLNLLMNKTMKWVMTQEFERHREADEYAYS